MQHLLLHTCRCVQLFLFVHSIRPPLEIPAGTSSNTAAGPIFTTPIADTLLRSIPQRELISGAVTLDWLDDTVEAAPGLSPTRVVLLCMQPVCLVSRVGRGRGEGHSNRSSSSSSDRRGCMSNSSGYSCSHSSSSEAGGGLLPPLKPSLAPDPHTVLLRVHVPATVSIRALVLGLGEEVLQETEFFDLPEGEQDLR